MGEGYIFSLSTLAGGGVLHLRSGEGGYPISGLGRGDPIPGPGRGGTPFQVQVGGYPIPGPGRGGTSSTPPE